MTSVRACTWGARSRDVDGTTGGEQSNRVGRRRRLSQQILEPRHLFRCSAREEQHAERAAEGWMRCCPAGGDRGEERVFLLRLTAMPSAARIAAVQDQVGHTIGMAGRVGDGDGCGLRDAEEREAVQPPRRRPPFRGRLPTYRLMARRPGCPRARTLARRSERPCGPRRDGPPSAATPGCSSRGSDWSATSRPARAVDRSRGCRRRGGRHPPRCRSARPASPTRR